ncbi:MAG: NB-ARC domain-containing protein [Pseudanabaena sp. ELA607]
MNLADVDNRNVEVALPFLQQLCSKHGSSLDPRELKLLECALENQTVEICYTENPSSFTRSIDYTKTTISPELWNKVTAALLAEIRQFNPTVHFKRANRASIWVHLKLLVEAENMTINNEYSAAKLHQVPPLENCYGREHEVDELASHILKERKRGVFLIGLAGIGKATLVNKFIHERALHGTRFSHIFWCPVRHGSINQTIDSILKDFYPTETRDSLMSGRGNISPAQIEVGLINQLIEVLNQHSILLVFPDWCSLFSDQESGTYLPETQSYKHLLDALLRRRHRSCLLLMASQLPHDLHHQIHPGNKSTVVSMVIRGLDVPSAQELLMSQLPELEQSEVNMAALAELVQQYGGHPWALTRLADIITHSFNNNVHALLAQQTVILDHPLEQLLANQFQRWEALEKKLLFHLSLACRPLTQVELYHLCCRQTPNSTLLNRLHKLFDRGIVHISQNDITAKYSIEPIVQKYLQNRFIELCSQEIVELAENPQSHKLIYLNDYYLVEPKEMTAVRPNLSANVIRQQQRLILHRIFAHLNATWKTVDTFQERLGQIMQLLVSRSWFLSGYAQHNVTELMALSHDQEFLSQSSYIQVI